MNEHPKCYFDNIHSYITFRYIKILVIIKSFVSFNKSSGFVQSVKCRSMSTPFKRPYPKTCNKCYVGERKRERERMERSTRGLGTTKL